MGKKSEKGNVIELVIIGVLVLVIAGLIVWRFVGNSTKGADNTNVSAQNTPQTTNQTSAGQQTTASSREIVIKEWGVKLVLNDAIDKANVTYTYTNNSVIVSNSRDPLVSKCQDVSLVITRSTKADAAYVAPGTIPRYSESENYGASAVVDNYYYFESGPQQACNGDYSIFQDPQHDVVKSIEKA